MNTIELHHGDSVRLTLERTETLSYGSGTTVELELHGKTLDGVRPHRITLDAGDSRILAAALIAHANEIDEDIRRRV